MTDIIFTDKKISESNWKDELVQEDRVHKSLYSDETIFNRELEKVFNHTWVWVAHESEIPDKGSYKTAMIGKQPVIVARDRKNNIHVLENRVVTEAQQFVRVKRVKLNPLAVLIMVGVTLWMASSELCLSRKNTMEF